MTTLASRLAVLTLALASSYYVLYDIRVFWGQWAIFGTTIDPATAIVNDLDPPPGIRTGDSVDLAAMSFRERGYLYAEMIYPVGTKMTVQLVRSGHRRTATFKTDRSEPHRLDTRIWFWSVKIVTLLFIATGVILVWNRPSVMLWGLAVYLIRTHDWNVGPLPSPAIAALVIFGYAFVSALGLPGLIVFAARFPNGRRSSATKLWDAAAGGVFVFGMVTPIHDYIPLFTARPIQAWPDFAYVYSAMYVAVFVALCIKLLTRKHSRAPLGWIVAGYGVGVILGRVGFNDLFGNTEFDSYWPSLCQLLLMLAMPVSVAYSIVRHHTFDLGYFTNRALVYAALTIAAGSTFVIGDWQTSSTVSSTIGIGGAMFLALLLGMYFQTQRGRAIRFVDRIFLPHRYEAGVSLDRIRETLRGTSDAKRITGEVAAALGLTSVAVFERTSDGGFVRNAACGWPYGTAWHLLPGEALTRSLGSGATVIMLPDELLGDSGFPAAHGRPRIALTIRRGGRVERAVLVGDSSDGASLDRDAICSVHGIFDDALVV